MIQDITDEEFAREMNKELKRKVDSGHLPKSALKRLNPTAGEAVEADEEDLEFIEEMKAERKRKKEQGLIN
ncbi:MAG: hypothetical protein SNI70_06095 [Rikenellaceae bacterium]